MGDDEEELMIWADVLDQVAARRPEPLTCPHCSARPLLVEEQPNGVTRISCAACSRFVEGRFG